MYGVPGGYWPYPGYPPGARPPMMGPPGMPPRPMMGGPPGMPLMPPPLQPPAVRPPAAASGAIPPGGQPTRSTTLWVGRIAPSVEASFVQQLLEACGPLKEWKPVTEPDSGRLKGFGFVTYEEPEGVLVALQVLNNLRVDGQELALKCNKATEEFLEWYKRSKAQRQGANGGAEGDGAPANGADAAAAAENEALGRVMELISQRPAAEGGSGRPDPVSAAAAADTFLSTLSASRDGVAAGSGERKRDRESEREAERERERQRQRREEQRREEAAERAYREALRQWEDHERLRQRELERERDRLADLARERQRQVHADNEAADSDEEAEPWRRRAYSGSRRAAERRRRRDLELQDDEADRRQQAEEEEEAARQAASRPAPSASEEPEAGAGFGADDSIMAAMLAAVKAKPEPVAAEPEPAAPADAAAAPAGAQPARRRVRAAFVEEEEEDKPQRRLIPIRYSEEELRALEQPPGEDGQLLADGLPAAAQPGAAAPQQLQQPPPQQQQKAPPTDPAALKRELLGLIPKDRAGVFAFPINWAVLDAAPADVKDKISGWVRKKVGELLGEEEASFCAFILDQLAAHTGAPALLGALGDVLDDEAEAFTTKLWQILIYEQLKLERSQPR